MGVCLLNFATFQDLVTFWWEFVRTLVGVCSKQVQEIDSLFFLSILKILKSLDLQEIV